MPFWKRNQVYRETLSLLTHRPALLAGLFIAPLGAALLEALGLGAVYVLLDTGTASDMLGSVPIIGAVLPLLVTLSLAARVRWAALLLVGLIATRSAFQYAGQVFSLRLSRDVEIELREQVFAQMHAVRLDFIQRQHSGGLMTILGLYTIRSGQLVLSLANALPNGILIVVYGLLALVISWQLTLLAMTLMSVTALALRPALSARIRQASHRAREAIQQAYELAKESLAGMQQLHLYEQREWSMSRLRVALNEHRLYAYRAGLLASLTRPLFSTVTAMILAVLLVGGTFILPAEDRTWWAQMALMLFIAMRLTGPMSSLTQIQAQITEGSPYLDAVLDFLRRDDKPYLPDGTISFEGLQTGVSLENVSFQYQAAEPPVLNNVTLVIPKGRLTAVVGVSGAGKSTLVNLIARLYDCTEGRVCVDGIDLRDLEIASWRKRLAVVSQETFLFHDTAQANLRFARPDASQEEIEAAARLAQAHDFLRALPHSYHTVLQERGARLSGGQQQRLSIARALLKDADLLILDEATSELDSQTEQALQQALERYRQGRAVLAIAHRLSTIRQADWIYVLEGGRVVEQGSREELLAQGGLYWKLAQAQAAERNPTRAS